MQDFAFRPSPKKRGMMRHLVFIQTSWESAGQYNLWFHGHGNSMMLLQNAGLDDCLNELRLRYPDEQASTFQDVRSNIGIQGAPFSVLVSASS
jgi:hypothetical protein